jgi:hypothetical protein
MLGHDGLEAEGDGVERFLPADPLEASFALAADPLERMEDALRAVDALQIVVDLDAQEALGEAVIGVATQGDGPAILHRHCHPAGVWAIVGADSMDHPAFGHAHPSRIGVGRP